MFLVLAFGLVLAASGAYTAWRAHQISDRIRPDGSFATVDGVKLHYHFVPASGEGKDAPFLVFLHGASGNAYDTLMAFRKALEGRYGLLFLDRPGLGFSERDFSRHSSPEGQAELIEALLERLGIGRAIVIGHSYGAAVTAALGLRAPERVTGLAFLAPASHPWPGDVDWYYKLAAMPVAGEIFARTVALPSAEMLAPTAIERVFSPNRVPDDYSSRTRLPLVFLPSTFRANSADIAGLKESVTRQSKRYPSLSQPALVVTGTRDKVVWPSIHSEGLMRDLPDADLLVLEGGGHMPHHTHTDEIISALDKLVLRVEAKTAGLTQQARAK
ncbi:alpha/beta hydrolase [Labrenzia aggregata]|uniref:Alpha/beta hydrolase n=2 Tax=Roseibium aggregatum TaxID=187304 RepID=A0A939EFW3_9HYPH|nr:alpha/beta hydrolase [Roseibium aggregatum]